MDTDRDVVAALRIAFGNVAGVECLDGDILAVARNTIVSPANSYGLMDGGIDAAYLAYFGPQVQARIRDAILRRPEGHLPVGAALAIPTGHDRIRFLIVAPTMHTPEEVPPIHCYRAMRALLRMAGQDRELGAEVFCPGLGTGIGRVRPTEAAEQMRRAYDDWWTGMDESARRSG